ncbi:MAG: AmmeMemoRadiSam system protein A, partial [Candidatus Omnitrophica bacterium]|nr:AmmeMemoRadiSam system protein A [Candidatus Omnitrophota bacterium]
LSDDKSADIVVINSCTVTGTADAKTRKIIKKIRKDNPSAEIVLIVIGRQTYDNITIVGNVLYEVLKDRENFVIVASTDMSHYLPYDDAVKKDNLTIEALKKNNVQYFLRDCYNNDFDTMCGFGAVSAVMLACKQLGAGEVNVLHYANSGDTYGDKRGVVGYVSAAFVKEEIMPKPESMFTETQRKTLLKIARSTISEYLRTGKKPDIAVTDPLLNEHMGAFVTLHEGGELRGCIGNLVGTQALALTVRDMAVEAAVDDPRFPPVPSLDELKNINIEISALSPMRRITNIDEIVMGKHGVVIKKGFRSGVFLPQVATETGWDKETFMNTLCTQKAGLPADAWKKGDCEIYIFTAEVFGEK